MRKKASEFNLTFILVDVTHFFIAKNQKPACFYYAVLAAQLVCLVLRSES